MGTVIAFVGLASVLLFMQASKRGTINNFSAACDILVMPALGVLLWKISTEYGWWTIVIFIASLLVSGFVTGAFRHNLVLSLLVAAQPILAVIFILSAAVCWFV